MGEGNVPTPVNRPLPRIAWLFVAFAWAFTVIFSTASWLWALLTYPRRCSEACKLNHHAYTYHWNAYVMAVREGLRDSALEAGRATIREIEEAYKVLPPLLDEKEVER